MPPNSAFLSAIGSSSVSAFMSAFALASAAVSKTLYWGSLALALNLLALPAHANPAASLQPVGQATLKVFFFTIYESTLYTPTGNYRGIEPDLALEIHYRRNISAQRLVDQTREEWLQQDLYHNDTEVWLGILGTMWPDVQRGDVLLLHVDEQLASTFYLNGQSLGRVSDPQFTQQFLAIWLDENSSRPELRDELIGR